MKNEELVTELVIKCIEKGFVYDIEKVKKLWIDFYGIIHDKIFSKKK